MMKSAASFWTVAALCAALPAMAEGAGDPVAGRALAKQHCARCHDIEAGGAFKTMPPSFASIAAFRTPDEITTRIWWPDMHSRMPQMSNLLTVEEVANLTAYIVSLEAK
jgi:mono/diheme cytochrome c family protein